MQFVFNSCASYAIRAIRVPEWDPSYAIFVPEISASYSIFVPELLYSDRSKAPPSLFGAWKETE
jgi:hypothetical protein